MIQAWRNRILMTVCCALLTVASSVGGSDITLNMSIWINEVAHIENTQKILDQYMMTNPGIQMGLIQQPWTGYHYKLIALVAGGMAPDVMDLSRL